MEAISTFPGAISTNTEAISTNTEAISTARIAIHLLLYIVSLSKEKASPGRGIHHTSKVTATTFKIINMNMKPIINKLTGKSLVTIVVLMATALGTTAKEYKYHTVKGDPMQSRIYTLDNGLKVYLSVNKEKPRIQTYIAVRTGSRNDPAETTGLAHYLEHIMFKGTRQFGTTDYNKEKPYLDKIEQLYEKYRKLTDAGQRKQTYHEIDSVSQLAAKYNIPNEYDKLMASIGAEGSNAYTSNDVTCYTEDIPSNEVENWAKIQSDRFKNMVIRGFHTELEAVYEEYNIGIAQDNRKMFEAIYKMLYPTHPYGTQSTIGTQDHLKNPSITNIKNYFTRYYVPNNVAICMSGDMDPETVIATIDRYFGDWKRNDRLTRPEYPALEPITEPRDTSVIGQEAEMVTIAWRMPQANSLAADTLTLMSKLLYNGKAGLIDLNLIQPMKIMDAYASYSGLHDYGNFSLIAIPVQGQKLEDVRTQLLEQVELLKRGEFDDDLLASVINNFKLAEYRKLESNDARADRFVDAFINDKNWEYVVNSLERISGITKDQIVTFANKYFGEKSYITVFKRQGVDSTLKKIDKPAITAIPSNREYSSKFLTEIKNTNVKPIEPKFVDFKRDLTFAKTKKGLPVIYKQNTENGLFTLRMRWEFGLTADKRYDLATSYIDYIGTTSKTIAQIKKELYKLGCSIDLFAGANNLTLQITGLDENMPQAMAIAEDIINNAKVDEKAYTDMVNLIVKDQQDNKKNQRANFSALRSLGMYGDYNAQKNIMNEQEMRSTNPQTLLDLIKALPTYKHEIQYYGPRSESSLSKLFDKVHKTPKKLTEPLKNKEYELQTTPRNEVWIAPYEAKNIYMVMFNNENKVWNPEEAAVSSLFNEYFGGGMNTVVFQELREARGLAYSAGAYYNNKPRKGTPEYGTTTIISQNDKLMDCIQVFNEILDTIPQSDKAFELAKQSLTKQLSSARTTKFGIINKYVTARNMGIDYDLDEKIYNALPATTLQDIVTFEQKTMAKKPYRYLILGDEKNLDMKALEKIGPIKRVSTEDIFGY